MTEPKMAYGIECDGTLIAKFVDARYRNTCHAELLDAFEDAEFRAVDLDRETATKS